MLLLMMMIMMMTIFMMIMMMTTTTRIETKTKFYFPCQAIRTTLRFMYMPERPSETAQSSQHPVC